MVYTRRLNTLLSNCSCCYLRGKYVESSSSSVCYGILLQLHFASCVLGASQAIVGKNENDEEEGKRETDHTFCCCRNCLNSNRCRTIISLSSFNHLTDVYHHHPSRMYLKLNLLGLMVSYHHQYTYKNNQRR